MMYSKPYINCIARVRFWNSQALFCYPISWCFCPRRTRLSQFSKWRTRWSALDLVWSLLMGYQKQIRWHLSFWFIVKPWLILDSYTLIILLLCTESFSSVVQIGAHNQNKAFLPVFLLSLIFWFLPLHQENGAIHFLYQV